MNDKSNKNPNYKPQDNSDDNSLDKFSNLEEKFHRQLKETEEKLDKEFEEELNKNFKLEQIDKKNTIKHTETTPTFKNSYTEKLNVAAQRREEALKKGTNKYIKYSGIGMEMIGSVLLGGFGGNWLDKKLDFSFPLFTIVFILLGLTATFTHLIMQLNADRKTEEEEIKAKKIATD